VHPATAFTLSEKIWISLHISLMSGHDITASTISLSAASQMRNGDQVLKYGKVLKFDSVENNTNLQLKDETKFLKSFWKTEFSLTSG